MAQKEIAGKMIDLTVDGYLTNMEDWTKEVASEIAKEEGVDLTDTHYQVIDFIREKVQSGATLTIRAIGKSGICDIKGFYTLFPGAPLKKASRISGVPKPSSCV